jgi:hypothetical protein
MPRKVPDDIGAWVQGLRRELPEEFTREEKRAINDLMHGVLRKILIHASMNEMARFAASETLNTMEPAGAAEMQRLQGGRREFVAMVEQLWEIADADET